MSAFVKCVRDFFRGLSGRHVDYTTRHHSRCYDVGGSALTVAVIGLPIVLIFGIGVVVGALIW